MRPVDVVPLLEHRQDLRLLRRCETVRGAPPRTRISQILACGSTARPAAMPPRLQLQVPGMPASPGHPCSVVVGDQAEQAPLRGTADARGERAGRVSAPALFSLATGSTFTAISASAARQRSASAFAAASSTSRPALRRLRASTPPTPPTRPAGRPRAAWRPSSDQPPPGRLPPLQWPRRARAATRSRTSASDGASKRFFFLGP